jgi:hypothetical protein
MPKPSTIRIDVMKIDKTALHPGKDGAKYLNLAIFENRDGPDKYDNTHFVVQDLPKERRDKGEKGAILGNAKIEGGSSSPRTSSPDRNFDRPAARSPQEQRPYKQDEDEIPF